MAVEVELLNANSIENINTNFQRVKEALEDSLSLSGDLPNSLLSDLDMNGNDLLNITTLDVDALLIDGQAVVPTDLGTAAPNSVGTAQLVNSSVTEDKIADGSVTDSKVSSDTGDRINATKVKVVSDFDVTYAPNLALRLNESLNLASLTDLTDATKFTNALQYAVNLGSRKIIIPATDSVWTCNGTITLPAGNPLNIQGESNPGRDLTGGTQIVHTGTGPMFLGTSGITGLEISNMKLYRSGTESGLAGVNRIGISLPGLVEDANLHHMWIEGFYNGIKGGATSYSYIDNVVVNKSTDHGILINNNATANGLQWSLNRCLAQLSGGSGYRWTTDAGTGPTSVGEMLNCNTYANGRYGLEVTDTVTSKLTGVRLTGGFYGEDHLGGVSVSSHRGLHKFVGLELEINGTATVGPPTAQSAASNAAWGIQLLKPGTYVNGTDFNSANITGSIVAFNTRSGVYSEFALTNITGNDFRSNGAANTAGANHNIQFNGTGTSVASVVTGNMIYGATGYGIFAQNDNHVWTGNIIGGTASTSLANTLGATSTNGTGTANGVYTGNKIA